MQVSQEEKTVQKSQTKPGEVCLGKLSLPSRVYQDGIT